ncbi:MAG: ATP-binding cassette domain-containing protein, partial [Chloroflexi bacterium]|nr:ATP-binding cassette domain-containing protein [Chloroflexota bacterium]
MPEDDYLVFKNIRKTFPGVVALEDISLSVRKGEIHAMLGENGAGKTTLMNILYGLHHADSGEIYFNGERLEDNSPRKAIRRGIGMIHQHFMLIPVFTVLENIALGQPSQRPPLLEMDQLSRDVLRIAEKFNIKVDLNALIEDLTVGSQQKVEILKALYKGAELLILDEPTSVLTPQEIQDLFRLLYELRDGGCTIIFISHKLNEVMQISDRITVLRDGKVIQTVDKGQTNPNELSRLMVGREVATTLERNPCCVGEACLALEHIVLQDKVGRGILKDISLGVCSGEIVGVAGVDDNGQTELAEVIAGLRLPSAGSIHMFGEEVTHATTRQRIEKGLSFIPADRRNQGLVVDSSIAENFILEIYYRQPFTR